MQRLTIRSKELRILIKEGVGFRFRTHQNGIVRKRAICNTRVYWLTPLSFYHFDVRLVVRVLLFEAHILPYPTTYLPFCSHIAARCLTSWRPLICCTSSCCTLLGVRWGFCFSCSTTPLAYCNCFSLTSFCINNIHGVQALSKVQYIHVCSLWLSENAMGLMQCYLGLCIRLASICNQQSHHYYKILQSVWSTHAKPTHKRGLHCIGYPTVNVSHPLES